MRVNRPGGEPSGLLIGEGVKILGISLERRRRTPLEGETAASHMQTGRVNGIPAKVLLSNRQYAALRLFTDERSSSVMDTGAALCVD
jgi:hypothetical protein